MMKNRGDYKSCLMWVGMVEQKNPIFPPINRLYREGGTNGGYCPHCGSSATYGAFGSIRKYFGAKKYCINTDCIFHYFDIRSKESSEINKTSLYIRNNLIKFVKNREREAKLERVLKDE